MIFLRSLSIDLFCLTKKKKSSRLFRVCRCFLANRCANSFFLFFVSRKKFRVTHRVKIITYLCATMTHLKRLFFFSRLFASCEQPFNGSLFQLIENRRESKIDETWNANRNTEKQWNHIPIQLWRSFIALAYSTKKQQQKNTRKFPWKNEQEFTIKIDLLEK